MKVSLLLFVLATFHVSASLSQSAKLDLNVSSKSLSEVIRTIEQQSNYRFFYSDNYRELSDLVSINIKNASINEVLSSLLNDKSLSFKILNDNVVIIGPSKAFQQMQIKGVVTDAVTGETIVGANIIIEGTTVGTVSDVEGRFSLNISGTNQVLLISFLGYNTERVSVNSEAELMVKLVPDIKSLEEVVVVGYGTQKKTNLTGAITELKSDDISKRMATNTSVALQGIAPGVTVTRQSSQPGHEDTRIFIRGNGSFSYTGPLVLIDGVESSLNSIDPNDIESMSVLKDASASSIYGSRAASGVILITSKRSKGNQMTVNYNGHYGIQQIGRKIKNVDGLTHIKWLNEANANDGATPTFNQAFIENYTNNYKTDPDHYPNVYWPDRVLKKSAMLAKHNLSLSGGGDKVNYVASFNYQNQDGLTKNTEDKRYSFRLNTDVRVFRKLTSSIDISGQRSENLEPYNLQSSIFEIWRKPAIYTPTYSDGRYAYGQNGQNPLATINDGGINSVKNTSLNLNIKLDYMPVEGLKFTLNAAPSYYGRLGNYSVKSIKYFTVDNPTVLEGVFNPKNSISQRYETGFGYTFRSLASYEKTISTHNFKILAGFEQSYNRYDQFDASRESRAVQNLDVLNAGQGTQSNSGTANELALRSYFGRFNYDYAGKYLFEANLRRDGSSRFLGDKRFGIFPSFSAGWRVSEENFIKSLEFINNFKVRASWGQLGNERAFGNYPFASLYGFNDPYSNYANYFSYPFNNTLTGGAALLNMPNTLIGWENSEMSNIGIDLGFLNNKLNFTAEYYIKNTNDILTSLPLAPSAGVQNPTVNAFSTQDKGWEITAAYQNNAGDFSYSLRLMVSDNQNEITDMKGRSGQITGINIRQEGKDFNSIYGYKAIGIFRDDEAVANGVKFNANTKPGDIQYADLNNDKLITDAFDRTIIGSTSPRYNYGGYFDFGYKGIELNLFIQGVGKRDGYLSDVAIIPFYNGGTAQEMHADHWTPDNRDARFPRFTITGAYNYATSSFWVQNAAYLKLKNVQLAYNLPESLLNKIKIKGLKIYVSGEDLLSFDHYKDYGFDPETQSYSGYVYPFMKSYSFGINVKF